ncbi:MAG: hypothetical protein HY899_12450 [Deltaproteobacteria bacterium]|nr:hypothetical protein [Deltaproteobacteria bacterium]
MARSAEDARYWIAVGVAAWLFVGVRVAAAFGAEVAAGVASPPAAQAVGAVDGDGKTGINEVSIELRRIADAHGPDSVALQAKFLLRSAAAGAMGPTEVKVVGPSTRLGAEYLEVVVDTGLFFEEAASSAQDRADQVWSRLAAPALEEMTSFQLKPAGLDLVFLYRVQDLSGSATGALDPSVAGRTERLAVSLDSALLDSVARDQVAGDALRRAVGFDTAALPER